MKKVLMFLLLFSIFTLPSYNVFAYYGDVEIAASKIMGDGTAKNPYLIFTEEELRSIPKLGLDKHYKLMNDITLADTGGHNWNPIMEFTGVFDGNSHVVRNMVIDQTGNFAGFFGTTRRGAVIKNFGIEDSTVTSTEVN